ncbi:sulfate transporter 3;5 isoform X2 [Wolffia australiana]
MDTERGSRQKLELGRRRGFGESLRASLKDIFFPDDPFRHLRRQPPLTRAWGAAKYFVPFLDWAPAYTFRKLLRDALAGLTIAILAIPQGIGYARLAGLPSVYGLYPSFVPPLVYALFGSSKVLAVGPVAAASLLLNSIISQAVSPAEDPSLYLHLFLTAAFFCGVFQLALGLFRLGILVDFLSRPTIVGFMGGTAIIIILQQLKGMLGLEHFTSRTDLVSVMRSVFSQTHEWKWQSVLLGGFSLIILLLFNHVKKRNPKLVLVSAAFPMLAVVMGIVIAIYTKGDTHGIPTVGPLKKGINPWSAGDLNFDTRFLATTLRAGLMSGTIALAEGIAVGRSFAMLTNDQIDGNKEMVAFGMMNIVGSMTSCYLTTGPFSKSAVNYGAGCVSAMSNVVMSVCVMLVLLFLAPFFKYTPLVSLSAIIITAMVGLIEVGEARRLFAVDKFDFCVCMAAFLGVVFFSMDAGLAASVGMSVLRALLCVARPPPCKLGRVRGTTAFRDIEQYPDARPVEGVLAVQPGSPIFFANCGYLRERVMSWVEESDERQLRFVVLDMGGVSSIDKTGIDMLQQLRETLNKKEIKLAIANPRTSVAAKLVASKFVEKTGIEWFFFSIEEAVEACSLLVSASSEGGTRESHRGGE